MTNQFKDELQKKWYIENVFVIDTNVASVKVDFDVQSIYIKYNYNTTPKHFSNREWDY